MKILFLVLALAALVSPGFADQPGYSDYWQRKTYEDNIVASRVGDPIKLCLVSIPLHCPKGDGRGREHTARDLRNHRCGNLGDSEHMCGGA
jgi:hypothetical protein